MYNPPDLKPYGSGSMNQFWLVWREDSPVVMFRHPTKESATREAERLASTNLGHRYFLLNAESYVEWQAPVPPVPFLKWTSLDDVPVQS